MVQIDIGLEIHICFNLFYTINQSIFPVNILSGHFGQLQTHLIQLNHRRYLATTEFATNKLYSTYKINQFTASTSAIDLYYICKCVHTSHIWRLRASFRSTIHNIYALFNLSVVWCVFHLTIRADEHQVAYGLMRMKRKVERWLVGRRRPKLRASLPPPKTSTSPSDDDGYTCLTREHARPYSTQIFGVSPQVAEPTEASRTHTIRCILVCMFRLHSTLLLATYLAFYLVFITCKLMAWECAAVWLLFFLS